MPEPQPGDLPPPALTSRCLRCNRPLRPPETPADSRLVSPSDYCSGQHRQEALQQQRLLRKARPGCRLCYRGAVFFEWRAEGGRQRVPVLNLGSQHLARCWCEAGNFLPVETDYKAWGFMRDFDLNGERELAPGLKNRATET